MSYVLILTIIHAGIGAVDVQKERGFSTYNDCADAAVARGMSQQELYPNAKITWHCQKE